MKKRRLLLFILGLFLVPACSTATSSNQQQQTNNENNGKETNNENSGKENENKENVNFTYTYYDDSDSFTAGAVKLNFNAAGSYEYLDGIRDKKVALKGFMLSSSPVDGSFIFLTNMPYQTCPFCMMNTSQLSNCFEVYPKVKDKFSFTENAVIIVGTLKVADVKDNLFMDKFEYEFYSKIVDAEIKILKDSDIDDDFTLRNEFAKTTLMTDIYTMFDYINFVCAWNTYYIKSYENAKGEMIPGYYLYPGDALRFIKTDGAQYNYGYKEGYFDSFITRINKISTTEFGDLIKIVNDSKDIAAYALDEIEKEHYTCELQYIEMFDTEDYIFTLNDTTLENKPVELLNRFLGWLTTFEK